MTVWNLPNYKGYTVDLRLKEFRKFEPDTMAEFIPFGTEQGFQLFKAWLEKEPEQYLASYDHYWGSSLPPKMEWALLAGIIKARLNGDEISEINEGAYEMALRNV